MVLNENGEIAYDEWVKLEERYPQVSFDVFQIMPNHIQWKEDTFYVEE